MEREGLNYNQQTTFEEHILYTAVLYIEEREGLNYNMHYIGDTPDGFHCVWLLHTYSTCTCV